MSALRPMISRSVAQASRYQFRTKATSAIPPHLRGGRDAFKKNWLSDPSTYPIIVVMGCGLTFMVGMGFNALFTYKDVQINPNKRGSMLQNWGEEEHRGVVRRFQEDLKKGGSNPEGLGIDHDEWVKQRQAYLEK